MMLALFLTEAAVGSLLILLLVPPAQAGRKFFQLTVGQSCLLIVLALALTITGNGPGTPRLALFGASAGLLMISAGLFHLGRLSAGFGLMVAGLLLAVVRDALHLIPAGDTTTLSRLLYPADALTSGLLPGSVLIAMILGHYYLNVPGLSIRHLQRLTVVFMAAVGIRTLVVALSVARSRDALSPLLSLLVDTQGREWPTTGLDPYVLIFLLLHIVFGTVAPAI